MPELLIESASADDNWGDESMLHVMIRRLKKQFSGDSLTLTLMDPQSSGIADKHTNVYSLPAELRDAWRLQRPLWSLFDRTVPGVIDHFVSVWPNLKEKITRLKMWGMGQEAAMYDAFLHRIDTADALLVSGGGFINDLFQTSERALNLIMLAHSRDVPVFMFGQGIGPIRSSRFWNKARRALPKVHSIALREETSSYPILHDLGMPDERITITGDDAISLAYNERPGSTGKGIGVNLRVAYYSEITEKVIGSVSNVVSKLERLYNSYLVPIPISHYGEDSDIKHIRSIIEYSGGESDGGRSLKSPQDVIRQVGDCRVVVTGSYHGGVFALSQGIPVVALTQSTYYQDKFHGLADMFGVGCEVLRTDHADFERELEDTIRDAWNRAPELYPNLLEAAEQQIDAADAAYEEMVEFLNSTALNNL